MKTTLQMHLYYDPDAEWQEYENRFRLAGYGPEYESHNLYIGPLGVDVEIPDAFDPRAGMLVKLEEQKTKLRAEFTKRIMEIDRQIQEYLALPGVKVVEGE